MYKAIVIRLLPTRSQAKLFWQNIGTARWTWNWGLAFQKK
ncbi:MAG: helix-turn-helix domain-containing protein [Synergistaceae bacterium]|nr:helix-turn-helix domain-containing protein [Synergistaceae bacterium]MBQ6418262.1 helix-turn-helix domain-containing protein [Synergistaceae bacterium]MBQ6982498.1 helix-turn-helix domain-containing protein [Synergistaceae bacterium]